MVFFSVVKMTHLLIFPPSIRLYNGTRGSVKSNSALGRRESVFSMLAGFRPWYHNCQGQRQNLKANVSEMIQMNNESGAVERWTSNVKEATACNRSTVWGQVQEGVAISQASCSPQPPSFMITSTHCKDTSPWPLASTWLAPRQEPFTKQAADA